jgi:hypothetical protein
MRLQVGGSSLLAKLTRIQEVSMFATPSPRWVVAGLSALVVAACGADDPTAPTGSGLVEAPERAGEIKLVPFKASYTWRLVSEAPSPGCDGPGEARAFLEGEGTATHLGRFTITLNHCGKPDLPLSDGHGTFVAANGDLLHITYFGVGGLTGAPPVFGFESRVTFVGGTGKFAGATGGATVVGTLDVRIVGGTGDWEGEISKP